MPIDPDTVGRRVAVRRTWDCTDCLVYALGVGAGSSDPEHDLAFTTENSRGVPFRALPTFATVLVGGEAPPVGAFDLAAMLHREEHLVLHRAIPVEGALVAEREVVAITDARVGALVEVVTSARDAASGEPLFTTRSSFVIHGERAPNRARALGPRPVRPARLPDATVAMATSPDQALRFRLSGDRNPVHSDPSEARRAGFERPILHGLCTFGFTGRAVLDELCVGDPARLTALGGRFASPALPGDRLDVEIWRTSPGEAFVRAVVGSRAVLDSGYCHFR